MPDIASPSQQFTTSHLSEADFKTGGLRSYSSYRDLGIAAATGGLATAHVIRMIAPFSQGFFPLCLSPIRAGKFRSAVEQTAAVIPTRRP